MPPTILHCDGTVFTELLHNNDMGIHRQTHRHMHPTIFLLSYVFAATGTCLPNRYIAMKGGIHFTKPFPINNKRATYTDTKTDGRDF
jgi:hypothetical protein